MGHRLQQARNRLGLTQKQLCDVAGVKQTDLSKLETGRSRSTRKLYDLAQALGCEFVWLRDGSGEPNWQPIDRSKLPPSAPANPLKPPKPPSEAFERLPNLSRSAIELGLLFDQLPQDIRLRALVFNRMAAVAIDFLGVPDYVHLEQPEPALAPEPQDK